MCPEFRKRKTEQTETATSVCFLQRENGNGKFVGCKWKLKTDICFPWSANDK
jgi:hypothetical protein